MLFKKSLSHESHERNVDVLLEDNVNSMDYGIRVGEIMLIRREKWNELLYVH
jgi:hypothetical protein